MLDRTAWGSATTSWPATTARPPVGRSTVLRMRKVVVFPAPLGPSSPKISPGWQSNETSLHGRDPAPLIVQKGFAEAFDVDHGVLLSVGVGEGFQMRDSRYRIPDSRPRSLALRINVWHFSLSLSLCTKRMASGTCHLPDLP